MSKEQTPIKDLEFYKSNAEEDYMNTPISVLRYITELENNTQAKVLEALERDKKEYPKMYWEAKQVIEDNKQRYHPSDRINAYGYILGFEHAIEFLKTTTKQK